MKNTVSTKWKHNLEFVSEIDTHHIQMDAHIDVGGNGNGIGPKKLMLSSLAGCTGIDVISILKKMRHEPKYFHIKVTGTLSDTIPKVYESMHLVYEFGGRNLEMEKLQKAVDLSITTYCGVMHMYQRIMTITHEIKILEEF